MRLILRFVLCVGVLLVTAACDPTAERRYFTEGAGVDLYTPDRAQQAALLNQYVEFVCSMAGPNCGGSWTAFVQAGMNDIDQRCDGFLTWLDARRRDKEPILAQLSALNTATHTIMTITGASPKSLEIATAAFGLATSTYINWNSRMLISVNQSTVQEVVYGMQRDFRRVTARDVIRDRPTAIYYLRSYLRICLPTTIEADINTSAVFVQRNEPAGARNNPVANPVINTAVRTRGVFVEDDAGKFLTIYVYPNGVMEARHPGHTAEVQKYMKENNIKVSLTSFLNSATYSAQRRELASRLRRTQ